MDSTVFLVDLGLGLLKQVVASLTKTKAPQQVIDAVQAAVDAVDAHLNDLVTKAALEAQRG